MQQIIRSENIQEDLSKLLSDFSCDKIFVLTDENTNKHCFPFFNETESVFTADTITISPGELHKNIDTVLSVWNFLNKNEATRNSLLLNLGGGMVTDLGGFVASTFKRGIKYINIPTTLLGIVDAAIGGKTGVNFNGIKNEIGTFYPAEAVLINPVFLKTLPYSFFLSGYAEMLKHSLLDSTKEWQRIISFDIENIDYITLNELTFKSIFIKKQIVKEDPFEKNIRKALNFGHTIGHAFESLSHEMNSPVQHGYAVAWGIVCELYLSYKFCNFPKEKLLSTLYFIKSYYSDFPFSCKEYDHLYELMTHDKKNKSVHDINFTLLSDIGKINFDQTIAKEYIFESIDFLRENLGF